MKNIFLIASIILTLGASTFSQTDSIMRLKEIDFSLFKMQKVKYQNIGEIKTEKQLFDAEDVIVLTFLSCDSLALINETANPVHIKLEKIYDVSKYKYRFSPVLGTIIGAAGAGLVGRIIGFVASGNDSKSGGYLYDPWANAFGDDLAKSAGAFIGALIGAAGGSIIGLVITNAINQTTLELFQVPNKDKKSELIKFLRQK